MRKKLAASRELRNDSRFLRSRDRLLGNWAASKLAKNALRNETFVTLVATHAFQNFSSLSLSHYLCLFLTSIMTVLQTPKTFWSHPILNASQIWQTFFHRWLRLKYYDATLVKKRETPTLSIHHPLLHFFNLSRRRSSANSNPLPFKSRKAVACVSLSWRIPSTVFCTWISARLIVLHWSWRDATADAAWSRATSGREKEEKLDICEKQNGKKK